MKPSTVYGILKSDCSQCHNSVADQQALCRAGMALLTARQTASLPRVATMNALMQVKRESGALHRCTSRPARHRSRHQAGQQLQEGCSMLESSLYHKGCVCVASLLLLTVTIHGLAKIQTIRCAVAAIGALMGTFLLAGWCSVKAVTNWSSPPTARVPFYCRPCISSVSLPC